jgi:hypothetical protein
LCQTEVVKKSSLLKIPMTSSGSKTSHQCLSQHNMTATWHMEISRRGSL